MFYNTDPDIPFYLNINPNYIGRETVCRYRTNEMDFIIEGDKIIVNYKVVFECVNNCEFVTEASFRVVSKFVPIKNKDEAPIFIEYFFNDVYSKIESHLQDANNIPERMILAVTSIKSEQAISTLTKNVFLELTKMGIYQ